MEFKPTAGEIGNLWKYIVANQANLCFYQTITEHVIKKGYQHQEVFIPAPKRTGMVEKQTFLAGWWGEQRPLTAIEIDNLIFSLRGVILAKSMFTVLTQIAKDEKLRKFCERGTALFKKRVERFQTLNNAENIPFQATFESEITASYIVETGTFLDDGLNLMIEKQWLEQRPMAVKK